MTGYLVHGALLACAWFGVVNVASSLVVAMAGRRLVADARARSAAWWLTLRCLPAATAALFVAAVFLPSYLRFEPRETVEGVDRTLVVFALAGVAVIGLAAVRGVRAWRRAARQSAAWMREATPLASAADVPAYTIGSAPAPLMALAGIASPRVFVSDRLVAALTDEELDATLAHEAWHARAGDNLKRLIFRLLPDALGGTRLARAIEQRWASAAEHDADRHATRGNASARCALASALVKAARLMPVSAAPLDPISTLVGGGDLASRVESLLGDEIPPARARVSWSAAAGVAALVIAYAPLLRAVHEITEVLVNSLP